MGRRPSGLPSGIREYSTASAWRDIVELALAQQVDAVLLTGDIVDRENRYYEALGPLESGVQKLNDAGIRVLAVSGNHDFDVLPRVARTLGSEAFTLLGASGNWERVTLERDGEPLVHVDGWSYTKQHERRNPLSTYEPEDAGGVPVVGMLHTDLDQPESPYAPVTQQDLAETSAVFWCLGHIHVPRHVSGPPGILYPGSPQGLDPTETRAHGPWVFEVQSDGTVSDVCHHAIARARFEAFEVDVSGTQNLEEVEGRLFERLIHTLENAQLENHALEVLSARATLIGHTATHADLRDAAARMVEAIRPEREGITAVLERIKVATEPALDLDALAQGSDTVGVLAALLKEWSDPDKTADDLPLITEASERMKHLQAARPYRLLRTAGTLPAPSREDARKLLVEQAYALLSALVAQKKGAR